MKASNLLHLLPWVLGALCPLLGTSCDDDPVDDAYYTFTGEMTTDYLEHREDQFSSFIGILKRAELWDLLSTYGEFTTFAPTNTAMGDYLSRRHLSSVDDLTRAECDTLAWTHLVKSAYFTTDLGEGSLPTTNFNDRYLTLSCDTLEGGANIVYMVNATAQIIARDDSVENGVVHVIDRVLMPNSTFICDIIDEDPTLTLFSEALRVTGLADSLYKFYDEAYTCGVDSTVISVNSSHHRIFGNNNVHWKYPATRRFFYTVFAEPDSVYAEHGIHSLADLAAYAKRVYDNTYPGDAGKYDDDYTHRRNPLNRFVAYHILDRYASYSELTVNGSVFSSVMTQFQTSLQDIMEFYETLCPYTIMQVCDAVGDKWVNRRGLGVRYRVRGSRILSPGEAGRSTDAINGIYHYIDDILTYNVDETINQVLNIRMRIDATTLSPDFMNAGARNCNPGAYPGVTYLMIGFKPGHTKNFIFSDDTFFGVHNRFWCNSWEDDMCACLDNFDIKFRIPPVPAGQTYEVRLGYVCGSARTVVQVYFDDNLTADIPCGIPIDLRKYAGEYGWIADADLGGEDEIEANDKALRNQGFMKAPDSFTFPNSSDTPRDAVQCLRRILTTRYLEPEHDYYIRLRQVLDNQAEMSLDYIELVPKSVYDGAVAEDRH